MRTLALRAVIACSFSAGACSSLALVQFFKGSIFTGYVDVGLAAANGALVAFNVLYNRAPAHERGGG